MSAGKRATCSFGSAPIHIGRRLLASLIAVLGTMVLLAVWTETAQSSVKWRKADVASTRQAIGPAQVAAGDDGAAIAVFSVSKQKVVPASRRTAGTRVYWSRRRSAKARFSAPRLLPEAVWADVGVSASGEGLLAYKTSEKRLRVDRLPDMTEGKFGHGELLGEVVHGTPSFATGLDGTAVLAWRSGGQEPRMVVAAARPPGQGFAPPVDIVPTEELGPFGFVTAAGSAGLGAIGWAGACWPGEPAQQEPARVVFLQSLTPIGPKTVSGSKCPDAGISLVLDRLRSSWLAISGSLDPLGGIRIASGDPLSGFSQAQLVSGRREADFATIASGEPGTAVVAWSEYRNGRPTHVRAKLLFDSVAESPPSVRIGDRGGVAPAIALNEDGHGLISSTSAVTGRLHAAIVCQKVLRRRGAVVSRRKMRQSLVRTSVDVAASGDSVIWWVNDGRSRSTLRVASASVASACR